MAEQRRVFRGPLYQPLSRQGWAYWPDALLAINQAGRVAACGPWESHKHTVGIQEPVIELSHEQLIIPGFVDLHVHLPQLGVTGCQAPSLLEWLEESIFQEESRFSDSAYARTKADWFFTELLKNGTTTAAVFLTSHSEATEIAFEVAEQKGNRVVMGLNLMDRNADPALTRPTGDLLAETERLFKKWHGVDDGRIQYAWMPRFAISCTEELLTGIGKLRSEHPEVYCHTHLSEQVTEVESVLNMFPQAKNYTEAYERFGLLGKKTLLAHGIHLSDAELQQIGTFGASLVHCPSSNFFLKSGVFRLQEVIDRGLLWGLGSDVGAGPELSLFKVMKDAQYMQPNRSVPLHTLFYAATLGGAEALMMQDRLGNLLPGKEADFVILDYRNKSNIPFDVEDSIDAQLSRLIYLGDDRLIEQSYVRGKKVYDRSELQSAHPTHQRASAVPAGVF